MKGETQKEMEALMRPAVTIREKATLYEALEQMVGQRRNSLLAVDRDGCFVGGVSALNLIEQVLPGYLEDDTISARFADDSLLREDARQAADTPVSEFMAPDMPQISEDGSLLEAAVLALRKGHGRIAVVDGDGRPVGVLTRTEIKQVIAEYLNISDEALVDSETGTAESIEDESNTEVNTS